MTVKTQHPIQLENACSCLLDEAELEKAILWYAQKPVAARKRIFMYGAYPAVSIHKEKIHVHRLLAMYSLGRALAPDEFVHHIDGNKVNARLTNLRVIEAASHQRGHNKGKTLTTTHKRRIAEANHNRAGMKLKKRVQIPEEELAQLLRSGWSVNGIAKRFGCDWSTVKRRIHDNPELLKEVVAKAREGKPHA